MNGLFSWYVFPVHSYVCEFLVKVVTSIEVFSALFYFYFILSYFFEKFCFVFQISVSILPALRFHWWRGRDCSGKGFSVLCFTLVSSAISLTVQHLRQSGWYSEEEL